MASDNNGTDRQDGNSDNNGQSVSHVQGGEFRNGRKSQIKNNNPQGESIPNEYVDDPDERDLHS